MLQVKLAISHSIPAQTLLTVQPLYGFDLHLAKSVVAIWCNTAASAFPGQ